MPDVRETEKSAADRMADAMCGSASKARLLEEIELAQLELELLKARGIAQFGARVVALPEPDEKGKTAP